MAADGIRLRKVTVPFPSRRFAKYFGFGIKRSAATNRTGVGTMRVLSSKLRDDRAPRFSANATAGKDIAHHDV